MILKNCSKSKKNGSLRVPTKNFMPLDAENVWLSCPVQLTGSKADVVPTLIGLLGPRTVTVCCEPLPFILN